MIDKPTILIVDDEPAGRDTLEALLYGQSYDLAFADSGAEALKKTAEILPDLILLDVMMPGLDGFVVCQRLKAHEQWRHIPVILVTVLEGADEFLSKPVDRLELRARVRTMLRIKRQFDELQATLEMTEQLSNMIVHDMRSPLTVILGAVNLLQGSLTRSQDLEDLDIIEAGAHRANSYLNDLLILAKVREGKLILHRSTVDVRDLVRTLELSYETMARARRINLVIDVPGESRQVSLDPNLTFRVLDNLLSNALKYSSPESTVTLRVEYPNGKSGAELFQPLVRFQVLDQGPGIPEEHRDRIFDQFEIIQLKKTGIPQIGLGLAFCRMVVQAHGGRIFVEANEPKGSVFTVEV